MKLTNFQIKTALPGLGETLTYDLPLEVLCASAFNKKILAHYAAMYDELRRGMFEAAGAADLGGGKIRLLSKVEGKTDDERLLALMTKLSALGATAHDLPIRAVAFDKFNEYKHQGERPHPLGFFPSWMLTFGDADPVFEADAQNNGHVDSARINAILNEE